MSCRRKSTEAHTTLESACDALKLDASDCVLFSPGGASFDLFKDYKERGARFKELILQKTCAKIANDDTSSFNGSIFL